MISTFAIHRVNVKLICNSVSHKRILYCYNACVTLRPIHFHLVPEFKEDPTIFHMLLQF